MPWIILCSLLFVPQLITSSDELRSAPALHLLDVTGDGLLDGGDLTRSYPGVDFLAAYWIGRHHGFVDDDTAGTCLVVRD